MTELPTARRTTTVRRVAWDHPDAVALRAEMAEELNARYADRIAIGNAAVEDALHVDPAEMEFVGVAYGAGDRPVGHTALRWRGRDLELKRVYVAPGDRGKGVSTALMVWSEETAGAAGAVRVILQTGDRQPDAVRLYERMGYLRIPDFPPYDAVPELCSTCMAKPVRRAG
ncbi:acetyltransferase (GNAT) family protein [Actinocorallia herbida]|uniref:Acetyltransferase (GNAT) family protein n=1 Tax=Actinocorallia herbida TaxID=58109 RepID=A0A3N1CSR5_9ACTN|nr:GNAT family N-acetyltransferase [Actinocorallia herbida]ROO84347.1 acetyltransferase (GNAT) family protein [Actinocorallia herbida]